MSAYSSRYEEIIRNQKNRKKRKRNRYRLITVIVAVVLLIVLLWTFIKFRNGGIVGDIQLKAGQSALYLQKDGKVTYGVAEQFKDSYLKEAQLQDQMEAEVEEFNQKYASHKEAMKSEYFDVSSDVAKAVFSFDSVRDFSEYMNRYNRENDFVQKDRNGHKIQEFYIGDVQDYNEKITAKFITPDQKSTVNKKDLTGKLLMISGSYRIQTDGSIRCVSDNCTVTDGIVTTKDYEISYIVYE